MRSFVYFHYFVCELFSLKYQKWSNFSIIYVDVSNNLCHLVQLNLNHWTILNCTLSENGMVCSVLTHSLRDEYLFNCWSEHCKSYHFQKVCSWELLNDLNLITSLKKVTSFLLSQHFFKFSIYNISQILAPNPINHTIFW